MHSSSFKYPPKLIAILLLMSFVIPFFIACNTSKEILSASDTFNLSIKNNELNESFVDVNGNLIIADKILDRYVKKALSLSQDEQISIETVKRVTGLQLNSKSNSKEDKLIKNIDALRFFINLEKLELRNNAIENITPLQNLKNLTCIDLGCNNVRDISALKELTLLKEITFCSNKVLDIESLSYLKKLEKIDFEDNYLLNIYALRELNDLKYINIGENPITEISPLSGKSKLEELWLNHTNIQNPEVISECSNNLKTLSIESCRIKDISFLQNCKKLENLNILFNNITDISSLQNLTSLNVLIAGHNDISDISVLSSLENKGAFSRKKNLGKKRFNIDLSNDEMIYDIENNQKTVGYLADNIAKVKL